MIKALSNAALVQHLNGETNRYFLSAEDLTNIPVVGLHQDLTHVAALGISHVERNGHHYVRGLTTCPTASAHSAESATAPSMKIGVIYSHSL